MGTQYRDTVTVTEIIPRIIDEAKRQFTAYVTGDNNAIHPSLRTAVLHTSIQHGGASEYTAVRNLYLKTTSIDGKEICLEAMGQVPTADLAREFMNFQFSDDVAVQDINFGLASLGNNPKARNALWDYVQNEWDKVSKKMIATPIIMDGFVKMSLSKFASHDDGQSISEFFKGKDTEGWNRAVVQVIDTVRTNAKYRERDEALVLEWLQAHDYV